LRVVVVPYYLLFVYCDDGCDRETHQKTFRRM
jgi:hypothetical protein